MCALKIKAWVKACRVHQWSKNALIFIPLLAAHQISSFACLQAIAAFFAFCLCASGVYILNDIIDLKRDRAHSSKNTRPFAAGILQPSQGLIVSPILAGCGLLLAYKIGTLFLFTALVYIIATTLYTFWVKRLLLLDVICLAGLYALRIFAGGTANHVSVSKWLLTFSVFFFLSLALSKRASELIKSGGADSGRQYTKEDLTVISQSGISSGYVAVLVLVLYINSIDIQTLYAFPDLLWGLCLLLLYWIVRMWILTSRGKIGEDPVLFAINDKTSQLIAVLGTIIILLATKWNH